MESIYALIGCGDAYGIQKQALEDVEGVIDEDRTGEKFKALGVSAIDVLYPMLVRGKDEMGLATIADMVTSADFMEELQEKLEPLKPTLLDALGEPFETGSQVMDVIEKAGGDMIDTGCPDFNVS